MVTQQKNIQFYEYRLLVAKVLGQSPEWVFMNLPTLKFTDSQTQELDDLVNRRASGEPLAKILGYKEFYSRPFFTNEFTLDPRPDSETLIDAVLQSFPKDQPYQILDLGLGTGCLLFTLLCERPKSFGVGVDFSFDALMVAKKNQENLGLTDRSAPVQGNWLKALKGQFDIIISNPPYISSSEYLDISTLHDPNLALFSGETGLEAYQHIIPDIKTFLKPSGKLFLEIGKGQELCVQNIALAAGLCQEHALKDLSGITRVLCYNLCNS